MRSIVSDPLRSLALTSVFTSSMFDGLDSRLISCRREQISHDGVDGVTFSDSVGAPNRLVSWF